jgi:ubiquinone biosynthesis monooxygenase Coq7
MLSATPSAVFLPDTAWFSRRRMVPHAGQLQKEQCPKDARTVGRILKVNHAGEFGAIRIYRAQIWVARRLYPDVVPFLEETLGHEIRHCALFRAAMPARQSRPCRIMQLWGNGGLLLGFGTALLGRNGIWVCTAAVERAVHRHLQDQLHFLRDRDAEVYDLIIDIQMEELSHLHHAEEHLTSDAPWSRLLRGSISRITDAVIWLSTWGDSARMARELAAANSK